MSQQHLAPLASVENLAFTCPRIASNAAKFLDTVVDTDYEYARGIINAFLHFNEKEGPGAKTSDEPDRQKSDHPLSVSALSNSKNSDFSSVGKVLTKRSTISNMLSNKIVPFNPDEKQAALAVFNSPEAVLHVKNFNKDVDVENEIVLQMDNVPQLYTEAEDEIITSGLGLLDGMKMKGAIPFKEFKTAFSATRVQKGFYNSKDGDIYVMSEYTVQGDHSYVAARIANYFYNCINPAFGFTEETSFDNYNYLEVPNKHSAIYCQDFKFPSPLSDREMIVNIVWKRISEKCIVVAYHPLTSHPKVENKEGDAVIRGSFHSVYKVTQIDRGFVEVEIGTHINFGGKLPKAIVNGFIIPNANRAVSHQQCYFANSIHLEDLTKEDGKLLGEILVNQIKTARKRGGWKKRAELGKIGVDEFLYISVAMRELLSRHPWIRAMLHEISLNQIKAAPTVHTALSDMKDQDAINLAKGLSTIILSNTEAPAAVDHWIAQNAALEEFEKEYAWMRSFFVEIAQFNLNTSNFGLRLRVFGGAVLSMVDLITDIYMTVQFFTTEGQEGYGRINAWLIGLTMGSQILLSYIQNSKKPSVFFQDTFFTLIGFRPALDAYRVGSGSEQEDHHLISPLQEMIWDKCIEMFLEAIPASIVQVYALLLAKEKRVDALVSIIISAATIAFSSSMISYDWDTSPANRNAIPFFYGYVPDKALGRAVCFLSMMSLTFAHVLLQTLACALLAATNPKWLVVNLSADMALFIIYKIVRKDFFYYVNLRGFVRLVTANLDRVGSKVLVNFTLLMHMRNPCEVGGLPFVSSLIISFAASFVSASLYSSHYNEGEEDTTKVSDNTLKAILASLYSIWFISGVVFIAVIKREYWHTFFSLDTASDYNKRFFVNLRDDQDEAKSSMFSCHPDVYKSWGDELMKPWTLENWSRWEEEKPAWFTDAWVESVPNNYIPYDWRVKYKKTKGRVDPQMRRRSSVQQVKMLMGDVEEK
ncbi:hypothetical protein TrST_g8578 [Triparma strigata]|uniref:Uncharacterized protein n=1 Tax=Triparma strigata TaxID=1606541 RepID=A0A9W6ZEN5_9STRA|nr:hypothetical protein TrST_g8578 [Triparma strigata]